MFKPEWNIKKKWFSPSLTLVFSLTNNLLHTISNGNFVGFFYFYLSPSIFTDSENPGSGLLELVKFIRVIIWIWNRSLSWYFFSITNKFFSPSLTFICICICMYLSTKIQNPRLAQNTVIIWQKTWRTYEIRPIVMWHRQDITDFLNLDTIRNCPFPPPHLPQKRECAHGWACGILQNVIN